MKTEKKRMQLISFAESPIFATARIALDHTITNTISEMLEKQNDEAEITLKIGLILDTTKDSDYLEDGDPARKTPMITAKISRTIKNKFDITAPIDSKGHLVKGEDGKSWYVYDGSPQMTIEDLIEEEEAGK